jgi:phytoene dehydrogenase-like protein
MKKSLNSTMMQYDYLVVGSGLSSLVFAALASQAGAKVMVLEAHEYAGGYGHTFQMGKSAKFNAQLHYVWNCGEGETVNQVLKKLDLDQSVTFERLDSDGFDRMVIPGYSIKIPSSNFELIDRLADLFPDQCEPVKTFLRLVDSVAVGLDLIGSPLIASRILRQGIHTLKVAQYRNATLQNVFDEYRLDKRVQTLLASLWLIFYYRQTGFHFSPG